MKTTMKRSRDYLVLRIEEHRIDSSNSASLNNLLTRTIESGEERIIVDLSKVKFMDSNGLAGLVPIVKLIPENGHMMLAALQPRVEQLFKLTKADSVFDIIPLEHEILESENDPAASRS